MPRHKRQAIASGIRPAVVEILVASGFVVVHDLEQAAPQDLGPEHRDFRLTQCEDCACRGDSVERADPEAWASSLEGVKRLADDLAGVFYCHVGMRQIAAYVHPDGRRVTQGPGDYDPPLHHGAPLKADGTPADVCYGWRMMATVSLRKAWARGGK